MTRKHKTHEDFGRETLGGPGSERGFGLVFATVFLIVGLWPVLSGSAPRLWSLAIAAAFLAVALVAPKVLEPLNRLWYRFGLLLNRIVSPVVLAVLFFATVMPIGLIMRLSGKDILRMRFEPDASTYWIERKPPGPDPQMMPKQF